MVDTSMLVRYNPFGEWVNIYYQPDKISEAIMLKLIRKGGCPNSRLARSADASAIMNPFIAAGDNVQIRLELEEGAKVDVASLPEGWGVGDGTGVLKPGVHYINIRTSKSTETGVHSIQVKVGSSIRKYLIEVVKLIR